MFEAERKQKILELLKEYNRVDIQGLNRILQASESTIRRDLRELEQKNLLKRTHGGAVALQNVNFEPTFLEKEISNSGAKKMIAEKAAQFIQEGDVVLLDSGTTVHYLAKELKRFTKLTVVTNAIPVAQELQHHGGVELIFLGGTLRQGVLSIVGPFAEMMLGMLCVDKAFVATNAIHPQEGLSTPNVEEASIKRKMIASAKKTILLADASKIGEQYLVKFADVSDIDAFITDDRASAQMLADFMNQGVVIHTVSERERLGH
ncbi:DeoR family transcriptional regulator [Paenibacillus elgii]|uniref:DeoR family transcriptional regulator n=1 Tax=Paenibacillus elgii TaxID=189691 RepID=A0A2T6G1H0_9BACL|nr:DeoR/GlpR family DNA-binding transcription regulator [Paenibacillus elgii]PUA38001.1 DeoR family transcriptional regulator [Paenibacillus elgii]